MTPSWLVMYASYIDSSRSQTASQLTFNAGSIQDAALLKVPLVHAGCLRDFTPLTVEITVVHDVSIGQGSDSDITYGISDGTRFVGFFTVDKLNFNDPRAPCYGVEGVSGATFTAPSYEPLLPKPSDSFYPGQYVITLKLDQRWGSCYTAHDAGFVRTAGYNNRLLFSNGLTLEVYKADKAERVGIKYIKVTIVEDAY